MSDLEVPTYEAFREALTPEHLRAFQIVHLAMGAGVILLGVVVGVLHVMNGSGREATPVDTTVVQIMTAINFLVAPVAWVLSTFVSRHMFTRERWEQMVEEGFYDPKIKATRKVSPAEACVALMRAADVIRMALIEGAGLFGLIVAFLAASDNILHQQPLYWINLVTPGLAAFYILRTVPTRETLVRDFREKLWPKLVRG